MALKTQLSSREVASKAGGVCWGSGVGRLNKLTMMTEASGRAETVGRLLESAHCASMGAVREYKWQTYSLSSSVWTPETHFNVSLSSLPAGHEIMSQPWAVGRCSRPCPCGFPSASFFPFFLVK